MKRTEMPNNHTQTVEHKENAGSLHGGGIMGRIPNKGHFDRVSFVCISPQIHPLQMNSAEIIGR